MSPRLLLIACIALVTGLNLSTGYGQTPASMPASAPAAGVGVGAGEQAGEALRVTITGVEGNVQVRLNEDGKWQKAAVGMVLDEGAEFRTAPRSAVRFTIPPDQTITLDRLGIVKVLQAVREASKVKTDIGMKYGRTRYDIEAGGLEHESRIRSPGSTLAIRGTKVSLYDQPPFAPEARSLTGTAQFRNFKKQMASLGKPGKGAKIEGKRNNAAETAVAQTRVDPKTAFAGRTEAEEEALEQLPSFGGIDQRSILAVEELKRLGGFSGTFAGVPPVDGPLTFDLIWLPTGVGDSNLDFSLRDPAGRIISAANPTAGSGSAIGTHSGDNPAGGGGDAEGVIYPTFYQPGKYQYTVDHKGGDPAQIFILVGLRNDTLKQVGVDPDPPIILEPGQTFTGSVTVPGGSSSQSQAKQRRGRR